MINQLIITSIELHCTWSIPKALFPEGHQYDPHDGMRIFSDEKTAKHDIFDIHLTIKNCNLTVAFLLDFLEDRKGFVVRSITKCSEKKRDVIISLCSWDEDCRSSIEWLQENLGRFSKKIRRVKKKKGRRR